MRTIEISSDDSDVRLRPPELDDAQAIYDAVIISQAELMPWMVWCTPDYRIKHTKEWLQDLPAAWDQGLNYQFAIFDDASGQFLGMCGLNHINRYYQMANLGYWVRSDRTCEGIASTATGLIAGFGFRQLGLQRLEIVTAVDNWASRRVAEKAGATYEGILRKRLTLADGHVDAAMHSLIRTDIG